MPPTSTYSKLVYYKYVFSIAFSIRFAYPGGALLLSESVGSTTRVIFWRLGAKREFCMQAEFGVVFCGGGPAALGPFVRAAGNGRLDELLARRVLIVEQSHRIGGGSLRHYGISSNSLGGAFLEALDNTPLGGPLDPAREGPAIDELRERGRLQVPLKTVGSYLDSLGAAIRAEVERHPDCAVACRTVVRRIKLNGDGALAITIESSGVERVVYAEQAVIAMGGQPPDHLERTEILPELVLDPYRDKLWHASALFDDRTSLPQKLLEHLKVSGRVVVIGGSHSAWSSAWVLLNDSRFWASSGLPPHVTLLHRDSIRLFYLTQKEAEEDGYSFDPVADVCPVSGRVNRVGGLKGDARDLARQTIRSSNDVSPIRLVRLDQETHPRAIRALLAEVDLVIMATGYRVRLPELIDESGDRIDVQLTPAGLAVTDGMEIIAKDGRPLSNVIAYGLGVQVPVSKRVGGEPSHHGAITSVWLYQHNVGEIALRSLLGPDRRPPYSDRVKFPLGAFGGD
jgi:hypothetical protein